MGQISGVEIVASLGLPDLQPNCSFTSLIVGKIKQKSTSQTIMNCAEGLVKLNANNANNNNNNKDL